MAPFLPSLFQRKKEAAAPPAAEPSTAAAPAASDAESTAPAGVAPAASSAPSPADRLAFVTQLLIGLTVRVQVREKGERRPLPPPPPCSLPSLPHILSRPPVAPIHPHLTQTTNGSTYEGVLHAATPSPAGLSVDLRCVRTLTVAGGKPSRGPADPAVRPVPTLSLPAGDVAAIDAADVRLGAEDVGAYKPGAGAAGEFGTDAEIGAGLGGGRGGGRDLQRWAPAPGVDEALEGDAFKGLEDGGRPAGPGGRGGGGGGRGSASASGWNQFAANEAKFGLKTDYNEEAYTTKLDTSGATPGGISRAEADRIAREIEAGAGRTTNPHLREERGGQLREGDEEALYSSVQRAPPPPPRPAAWSGAGSGVAAVAGRPAGGGGASPQDEAGGGGIDARKESNKLRARLGPPAGGGGAGAAPGPAPPTASPLVGDAAAVAALDLNPGAGPKFDAETRRDFAEFKARKAAEGTAGGAPAAGAPAAAPAAAVPKPAAPSGASPALNPNAPAFVFNPTASSFVPGGGMPPSTSAAAAAGRPSTGGVMGIPGGGGGRGGAGGRGNGGGWTGRPGSPTSGGMGGRGGAGGRGQGNRGNGQGGAQGGNPMAGLLPPGSMWPGGMGVPPPGGPPFLMGSGPGGVLPGYPGGMQLAALASAGMMGGGGPGGLGPRVLMGPNGYPIPMPYGYQGGPVVIMPGPPPPQHAAHQQHQQQQQAQHAGSPGGVGIVLPGGGGPVQGVPAFATTSGPYPGMGVVGGGGPGSGGAAVAAAHAAARAVHQRSAAQAAAAAAVAPPVAVPAPAAPAAPAVPAAPVAPAAPAAAPATPAAPVE